ncbi:MAG: DUF1926 domain-containing protein [Chloroflexi bacterium]|nr:DUF1926 domain-containing protein [Chloroflexota bacterium]
MKQIYLGLAFHNHQPVGNFPWVFGEAFKKAYLPMLQALEEYPDIRVSLHYTGPLLDWLKEEQPEFLRRLARLAGRDQVEIIAGAYYEPVLPAIPDADKKGQIAKHLAASRELFGSIPTGLWLAERVWEPHLPAILADAGIEYTLLDDSHFKMVGLDDADLFGYYLTEEQGHLLKAFPTSKYLRYSIPWKDVEEIIAYLKDQASEKPRLAVMGDDGEKFGIWPGTYLHCWQKGWMTRFFQALTENRDWLHLITLGDYTRRFPPLGRVYLPCASYDEMMEWALPAPKSSQLLKIKRELEKTGRTDVLQFVKGGYWRYFLVRYPEINWMYKKMLRVHHKVSQARVSTGDAAGQEDLWQAQCNCPYWHGVFGGLYLTDIRAITYQHLIAAENKADAALHDTSSWIDWEKLDFEGDGFQELLVESNAQNLYFVPHLGGALAEWDLRHPAYNLLSTLARRPEAYHEELLAGPIKTGGEGEQVETIHAAIRVKEELPRHIVYDAAPRYSLLDHLLPADTKLEDFRDGKAREIIDLINEPHNYRVVSTRNGFDVEFRCGAGSGDRALQIDKSIKVERDRQGFEAAFELTNAGTSPLVGLFGSEWNINLLGGGQNPAAYYSTPGVDLPDARLDSQGEMENIAAITLGNSYLQIEVQLQPQPKARLWRFPVSTVTNSEAGVELVYQGSCLVFLFPLSLQPKQKAQFRLSCLVKTP